MRKFCEEQNKVGTNNGLNYCTLRLRREADLLAFHGSDVLSILHFTLSLMKKNESFAAFN